jgi:hypothetical protein
MKLAEISAIAKSQNISPGKLTKTQLIKLIQTAEGNFDCFATARNGDCDQINCCWRSDCFAAAK